ncbi:hypothetical protein MRF4_21625 [Methylobacterium radiotolerans]
MVVPGLFGWSPVSTGSITAALRLDRGLFATWRCRGIGPVELPPTWFRPAPGRPCYYMVSDVQAWIAARRGEPFDRLTSWQLSLQRDIGQEETDPDQVRKWAHLYAQAAGPRLPGGVAFTPAGFRRYLATLLM